MNQIKNSMKQLKRPTSLIGTEWQNMICKIVAGFFSSERFLIFANIAKISDSVDFEQP